MLLEETAATFGNKTDTQKCYVGAVLEAEEEEEEEEEVMGDNQYQWKCVSLGRKAEHTLEVYEV